MDSLSFGRRTMADKFTPRQTAFIDAFQSLMAEYGDVVGPVIEDGDGPENGISYTAEELASMQPVRNAVLMEWIVVSSWTCLDDNEAYTSAFTMPNMPTHHRVGLLQTWVNTWG